jgi:hypothetical protein
MSDLFASLKADLTSRRMLPVIGVALAALIGALAYVALGAKSSGSPPAPSTASTPHVTPLQGPTVSSAPENPHAAVSETTVGSSYQHRGKMRDPFAPLKDVKSSTQAKSATKSSGSSASSSSGGGSSQGGESPAPSTGSHGSGEEGSHPTSPSTSITRYHVDVSLQRLSSEGNPVGEPQRFQNVTSLQPLPSKHEALVEPEGVTKDEKGVVFLLVGEVIIHGSATCAPSAGDCTAISLKLHDSEELQYEQSEGAVAAYRLTVTKIERFTVNAANASATPVHFSKAGSELNKRLHLSVPSSASFGGPLGTIAGVTRR